jgi:hypothetical protein
MKKLILILLLNFPLFTIAQEEPPRQIDYFQSKQNPKAFKFIQPIGDGRFVVTKDSTDLGLKYAAIVDKNHRIIYPFKFTHFAWIKGDLAFAIDHINKKRGLLRISKDEFRQFEGDPVFVEPDLLGNILVTKGLDLVKELPGVTGLIDSNFQEIYPMEYSRMWNLFGGPYYAVSKTGKYAIGDRNGNLLTDFDYSKPNECRSDNEPSIWNAERKTMQSSTTVYSFSVLHNSKTGLSGLFHYQKGWLFGDTCRSFQVISGETFIVQKEDANGHYSQLFNLYGKALAPMYEEMQKHFGETIFAKQGQKVLLLDKNGIILKEIDADRVPIFFQREEKVYCFLKKMA